MNLMDILIPALIMFAIALFFALLLSILGKKLVVKVNENVSAITKCLSGANCGACGRAGCADFAEALVKGTANINDCTITSKDKKMEIANILNINLINSEDTIVIIACNGGNNCVDKYSYQGYGDCKSMELLAGGRKACPVGCMGMGTCTDACSYHAIEVNMDGVAFVNDEKCTKCGACIIACPKGLIKRIPAKAQIYIACSNRDKGKVVRDICKNGCIACGLCAKVCPECAITMVDNLPIIDYDKCTGCKLCATKCPTGTIRIR